MYSTSRRQHDIALYVDPNPASEIGRYSIWAFVVYVILQWHLLQGQSLGQNKTKTKNTSESSILPLSALYNTELGFSSAFSYDGIESLCYL